MREKYLRVKLNAHADGIVSGISGPFTKLVRVAAYVRRVMAGSEPMSMWTTREMPHPVSGAPCVMRERLFLNGRDIVSIEEVKWTGDGSPNMDEAFAAGWTVVAEPAHGPLGTLRVHESLAGRLGVPTGTKFPVESMALDGEESSVVKLNVDGSRVYSLTLDGVYENGVRLDPPVLDEEDAAAGAGFVEHDEDSEF